MDKLYRVRHLWRLVQQRILEALMADVRHILHAYPTYEAAQAAFHTSELVGERRQATMAIMEGGNRHIFRAITDEEDVRRLAGMILHAIEDHGHTCSMQAWSRLQALVRWV